MSQHHHHHHDDHDYPHDHDDAHRHENQGDAPPDREARHVDPTAALDSVRRLVTEADTMNPADDPIVLAAALDELATLFAGLDQWMSTGGFLPQPWAAGRIPVVAR